MWVRVYSPVVLLIFISIIFEASCKGNGSLTFLIDDTSSMHDDINQVRRSVNRIMDIVFNEKSSLIDNMVLVTFNDPDAEVRVTTKNRGTFKRTLDTVYAHNVYNPDCWEPSMQGLLLALETSHRDSYIYVFTDAPARDYRDSRYVIEMCQRKQSQIVFVLTGRCHDWHEPQAFDVYFDIADACSGLAFDVTKGEVDQVLRTIEETIKGNKTVLTTTTIPANVYKDIPFTIDDHTDYAIVSVSGKNVYLNIRGPAYQERIMWNNNGKVVKLSNVKPGTYVATVMGQTRTSVVIVGRTDFLFSHGFSELKPNSLSNTSPQPIVDANVHLSISVTDEHHSVKIESAQILQMDEKPIRELPLTEISKDFYMTTPFVAPSQMFKVAVKGIVKATGQPIRRIAKIPVTPRERPKAPPVIISNSTIIQGMEGDVALRIPCDVTGIPKPVITWKLKGTTITPNEKYLIEDGALVIMNPKEKDSLSYTCEAKNSVGTVSATVQADVKNYLDSFGTKHYVYLLKGETRKLECEAYISKSQSILWFTNYGEQKINETYMQIESASYADDGNYTCRVSDKHGHTQTHTYVVDVGNAPKLDELNSLTDWRGDIEDIVWNCDSNAKPRANVQWKFNGEVITEPNLPDIGITYKWGQYTCNVSNVHGSVQKSFDVKSSVCLISRNLRDAQFMPLVLTDEGTWPTLENTRHYSVVEKEEKITLSCPSRKEMPNTFKNFPKQSELKAFCYKEDTFLVDGKMYKLSDLQCNNGIQPSVIRKKVECSTKTSELLRVGYNVGGFLETYEVCFDHAKNMPLYTRALLTETNDKLSAADSWYTYPGIGDKMSKRGFNCTNTLSTCCYGKSQLVSARDLNNVPAKNSTFIDPLNAVPAWRPCLPYKTTWDDINDMVTAQLINYGEFVAWSGTHTFQEKHGAVIPRYLWKVLRFKADEAIAIVHVNDPTPTEKDIKCKNICTMDEEPWFHVSDKYTYCCSLPDFFKAFNMNGTDIGESLDAALEKIEKRT